MSNVEILDQSKVDSLKAEVARIRRENAKDHRAGTDRSSPTAEQDTQEILDAMRRGPRLP